MNGIVNIAYNIVIIVISALYYYLACKLDLNIVNCISAKFACYIFVIMFRSYTLFYASLIAALIITYRYYRKTQEIDTKELMGICLLVMLDIILTIYALFRIIHYYPSIPFIQMYLPSINISLIEITPIISIMMVYSSISVFIISLGSNLSLSRKKDIKGTMRNIVIAVISIALIIIIINAVLFFVIHNFPLSEVNGIFDGNFLKDPIKHYYRLSKSLTDCLWFSATTFFTVGYGDMHPIGNIMYLLSIMEMISAYILGIIIIPILLFKASNS